MADFVQPIRGDDRDLWEKQPGEPQLLFEAFEGFLRMGPRVRTHRAIALTLKKSQSWVRTIALRWSWAPRVAAWDAHCARQRREQDLEDVLLMRDEQKQVGRLMRELGLEQLQNLVKRARAGATLTPNEIRLMLDAGFKHEGAALGEATTSVEVKHRFDQINVEKLTDEQLRRIAVDGEDPAKVLKPELEAMEERVVH